MELKNSTGYTALCLASRAGSVVIVRRILESGANINAPDCEGWTELHEACEHGRLELVKLPLTHIVKTAVGNRQRIPTLSSQSSSRLRRNKSVTRILMMSRVTSRHRKWRAFMATTSRYSRSVFLYIFASPSGLIELEKVSFRIYGCLARYRTIFPNSESSRRSEVFRLSFIRTC